MVYRAIEDESRAALTRSENRAARLNLGRALLGRGWTFHKLGQREEAAALLDEAIVIFRALQTEGNHKAAGLALARALRAKTEVTRHLEPQDERLRGLDEAILSQREALKSRRGSDLESTRISQSLVNLLVEKAEVLAKTERPEAADAYYDSALQILRQLIKSQGPKEFTGTLAWALKCRAMQHMRLGQSSEALAALDECINVLRPRAGEEPRLPALQGLANALRLKAHVVRLTDSPSIAGQYEDEALDLEQRISSVPSGREFLPDYLAGLNHKASAFMYLNKFDAALSVCDEVIASARRHLAESAGPGQSDEKVSGQLARALGNVAALKMNSESYGEAGPLLDEALAIFGGLAAGELTRELLAVHPDFLAMKAGLLVHEGQFGAARHYVEEADTRYRQLKKFGYTRLESAEIRFCLTKVSVLRLPGEITAALDCLRQAEDLARNTASLYDGPSKGNLLLHVLLRKSSVLLRADQIEQALVPYDEIIGICRAGMEIRKPGNWAEFLTTALVSKGFALRNLGRLPGALQCWEEGLAVSEGFRETVPAARLAMTQATIHSNQAEALLVQGHLEAAKSLIDAAVTSYESGINGDGFHQAANNLAWAQVNRAMILERFGDAEGAEFNFENAIQLYQSLVEEGRGDLDEELSRAFRARGLMRVSLNQWAEAESDLETALVLARSWIEKFNGRPTRILLFALSARFEMFSRRTQWAEAVDETRAILDALAVPLRDGEPIERFREPLQFFCESIGKWPMERRAEMDFSLGGRAGELATLLEISNG